MNRFIDLLGKFTEQAGEFEDENGSQLPDFGPVDIPDYRKFLEQSKSTFYKRWISLKGKGKEEAVKLKDKNYYLTDFKKQKLIGTGSFGQVYLVLNEKTGNHHAMKCIAKKTVIVMKQLENTRTEKLVLQCSTCPFTLRLDYFFRDNSYLYFVVPFIQGGELYQHLLMFGKFKEITAMFYVAQVILALEYLHFLDIVYRDLKPENILLDHTGYIKLTDFGFCKHLRTGRTYTFCGTLDYLAPEIVLSEGYGKAVDWWGVGVLAYELASGNPPFKDKSDTKKLKRIVRMKYSFPPHMSLELKNLITQTLQRDLSRRYGNLKNGVNDFKNHKWFKTLNWQALVCRKATPSYLPECGGPADTRHFREYEFRSLQVADRVEYETQFADF